MPTTWISKKPDRCGGDACIRETRIPVWVLHEYRRLGQSDEEILVGYPTLTKDDLQAAWDYVAKNSAEIEEAVRENEADEAGFVP
jgi:uncharacterized protein (DUF433 family)